jgi:hypothetical protein
MNTVEEDVEMMQESDIDTLLKLADSRSETTFLIKMPSWIADKITNSPVNTEIGFSQDIMAYLSGSGPVTPEEPLTLVLSSSGPKQKSTTSQPSEYSISLSSSSQNLRVFETSGSTTFAKSVRSTMHVIPRRDEKYAEVLRERMAASDASRKHRTIHNEEDYSTSRTAVKLFQRPDPSASEEPLSSPNSDNSRISKRLRGLDEMPQRESREGVFSSSGSPRSLDDALMETLVQRDEGWPLQQLSKALKDKGVSAPMAQLKAKLLEICVYQRRGEDTHPRYYLKSEYK